MNRRDFIRNWFIILAMVFLPKSLWPSLPEIEEEMVDIGYSVTTYKFSNIDGKLEWSEEPMGNFAMMIPKTTYEGLQRVL